MSLFHNYSINNLFLIMAQKPNATRIAGFRTWKKINRKVKKGEKGIRIFAPVKLEEKKDENMQESGEELVGLEDCEPILYFRTVCVFDITQTEGDTLPEPTTAHGDATELIPQIEQAIRNSGIELEYGDTGEAMGKSLKGKIIIKPDLTSAETFSVLIHEYAHELLHQTGESIENKTICELETDAVACVVCEHYGIHALQASADYIRLWDGDKEKLLERMDRVRECANTILERMENKVESNSPIRDILPAPISKIVKGNA